MKKTKKPDGSFLELTGKVHLVTRKNGKVVEREELDGTVVLQAFIHVLEQALERLN